MGTKKSALGLLTPAERRAAFFFAMFNLISGTALLWLAFS